jgi:tetratricopeptide (TPR) repeat protein/predicted Ser/Thr protein kinase
MPLSPGERLGPYEILAPIGAGGMGNVYKARDTRLGREVAIKVSKEEFSERFGREARAIAALNHPNICQLYDVGPNCLVMELVDGRPLKGPLPLDQVVRYVAQVADALGAAHAKGIVHRDIKPSNVFLTERSGVKVLDFGLAKQSSPEVLESEEWTQELLTQPGTAVGTVPYMSPEQVRGQNVDARSDLWSLGVMLYELAAGVRPFEGATQGMVLEGVLSKAPVPVRERNPKVTAGLERVIGKLLQKGRERRYQSAAELRDNLHKLTVPNASHRPWLKYVSLVAALAIIAGAVWFWQHSRVKPLTDKDVLVLADFTNTTGDPVFDGTLREALAIQIERSPFLKVMGDEQVRQDLKFMGRSTDEHITNQVARQICQREDEKAMIGGSIARFGTAYAVTVQATNCQTGERLASEETQVPDKEHVLEGIATTAKEMRRRLGESLASIQKLDRPVDQVTTASLEALQAYSIGLEQFQGGDYVAALPALRRATDLDPNFGAAWRVLSLTYRNAGYGAGSQKDAMTRAFALRDRVSEKEGLSISGGYYRDVGGEPVKAAESFQSWVRAYPRDPEPHISLYLLRSSLGEFEEALTEAQEGYRMAPRFTPVVTSVMTAYASLDRFDEARTVAEKAFAQKLDSPAIHEVFLSIAYMQDDTATAEREIGWFKGQPEDWSSVNLQAQKEQVLGQFSKARELLQRGAELARQHNLGQAAALLQGRIAAMGALLGYCAPMRDIGSVAVLLCADAEAPLKSAEQDAKQYPDDTRVTAMRLPVAQAAADLKRDQAEKAVEILRSVAPYERASERAIYYRAIAYLRLKKGAEAAVEFQKILHHKGAFWGPEYPLAYLGLARAEMLAGDTAKARTAYQDFLALWKDADPDLPVLVEARKEYAALK